MVHQIFWFIYHGFVYINIYLFRKIYNKHINIHVHDIVQLICHTVVDIPIGLWILSLACLAYLVHI